MFKMFKISVPIRFYIGVMLFLMTIASFFIRVNLSITILGMVNPSESPTEPIPDYGPRYNWTSEEEAHLQSAYFYGTIVMLLPSAILTERFGSRVIIGAALCISAALTALLPIVAEHFNFWLVFIVRAFTGLACAFIYPGQPGLIAKWSPPQESSKFIFTQIAGSLGTVIAWPLLAMCMQAYGWAIAFYIPAGIGVLTSLLWFFVVYNSPAEHPWISPKEIHYIENSLQNSVTKEKKSFPPFLQILKSRPFWAVLVLYYGNMWAFFFFLTAAPTYLNRVLKFDLEKAGFLGSLPYLCRFLSGFVFSAIGDALIKHKVCRVVTIRRYFCITSHIIPGILLFCIRFVSDNAMHCVIVITCALTLNGSMVITNLQNALDLAPNYAATLFSMMNIAGYTSGILAPLVVSYFTKGEQHTASAWNHIFTISSIVYIATAIFFMIFCSGDIQEWNNIRRNSKKSSIKNNELSATNNNNNNNNNAIKNV